MVRMTAARGPHSEPSHQLPLVAVVMGVSGSGKTTVGRLLAQELGWEFADADSFHSPENVEKMRRGVPLDDDDRRPWLEDLARLIGERLASGAPLVLACSALKQEYRALLQGRDERVKFVYLKGSRELIRSRLAGRRGHYMSPELLDSQFRALQEPSDALVLDVGRPATELAQEVARRLRTERYPT